MGEAFGLCQYALLTLPGLRTRWPCETALLGSRIQQTSQLCLGLGNDWLSQAKSLWNGSMELSWHMGKTT